jgi:AcrR family transcriptional regulator
VAKPGRRPGPTVTREQILTVAQAQFSERGYDKTTLRSIAQAARVHPALLHYHFGTKQGLYGEALDLPVDPWEVLTRLLEDTPRDQVPAAFVRHFLSTWRDPEAGGRLRARARRTLGEPEGAALARAHLESVVIPRIARALGVPEVNVAAAVAHLLGLNVADSILGIRQLQDANEDDLVTLIGPVIELYFRAAP